MDCSSTHIPYGTRCQEPRKCLFSYCMVGRERFWSCGESVMDNLSNLVHWIFSAVDFVLYPILPGCKAYVQTWFRGHLFGNAEMVCMWTTNAYVHCEILGLRDVKSGLDYI